MEDLANKILADVQRDITEYFQGFIGKMQVPLMPQAETFAPYKILGLEESASDEEVAQRFRELSWHLHPDTAGVKGTELLFNMVMVAHNQILQQRKK